MSIREGLVEWVRRGGVSRKAIDLDSESNRRLMEKVGWAFSPKSEDTDVDESGFQDSLDYTHGPKSGAGIFPDGSGWEYNFSSEKS